MPPINGYRVMPPIMQLVNSYRVMPPVTPTTCLYIERTVYLYMYKRDTQQSM